MSKYIDAEKLKTKVKELNLVTKTYEEQVAFNNALAMVVEIITSLQQEQPEVDLDREIIKYKVPFTDESEYLNETTLDAIARHFYGLRNRALEEAARHVYESWMGGTMDDVRRDMVELGKVIKARNKE